MDLYDKEVIISRITAGILRFSYNEKTYYIKTPSVFHKYVASEIYQESLKRYIDYGLYEEKDLVSFLINQELWSSEKDKMIKTHQKNIEDFKVALYEALYKKKEREAVVEILETAKEQLSSLIKEKTQYSYLSARNTALIAKAKYLIGVSIFNSHNQPVFTDDNFWESSDPILGVAVSYYNEKIIEESVYREIARSEPWRTLFNISSRETGVFGKPAVELSDEQRALLSWSSLYSQIFDHPQAPPEEVIGYDDMLDGWLIKQRREKERNDLLAMGDALTEDDKIKNSQEVYVMADNPEYADKINDLNNDFAKSIKQQRQRIIEKKGTVNQTDLPDVKLDIRAQMSQARNT